MRGPEFPYSFPKPEKLDPEEIREVRRISVESEILKPTERTLADFLFRERLTGVEFSEQRLVVSSPGGEVIPIGMERVRRKQLAESLAEESVETSYYEDIGGTMEDRLAFVDTTQYDPRNGKALHFDRKTAAGLPLREVYIGSWEIVDTTYRCVADSGAPDGYIVKGTKKTIYRDGIPDEKITTEYEHRGIEVVGEKKVSTRRSHIEQEKQPGAPYTSVRYGTLVPKIGRDGRPAHTETADAYRTEDITIRMPGEEQRTLACFSKEEKPVAKIKMHREMNPQGQVVRETAVRTETRYMPVAIDKGEYTYETRSIEVRKAIRENAYNEQGRLHSVKLTEWQGKDPVQHENPKGDAFSYTIEEPTETFQEIQFEYDTENREGGWEVRDKKGQVIERTRVIYDELDRKKPVKLIKEQFTTREVLTYHQPFTAHENPINADLSPFQDLSWTLKKREPM